MVEIIKELRKLFEGPKGSILFFAIVIIAVYLLLQILPALIKIAIIGGLAYFGYVYFTRKK